MAPLGSPISSDFILKQSLIEINVKLSDDAVLLDHLVNGNRKKFINARENTYASLEI